MGFKIKHGLARHPIYHIWHNIKQRCYNKNNVRYSNYGGDGVTMCQEWVNSFQAFYDWALMSGYSHELELDKDIKSGIIKMYSPETCCFVKRKENVNNRRNSIKVIYNNEVKSLYDVCEIIGIQYKTVFCRVRRLGWDIKKAIETPVKIKYRNHVKCRIGI